MSSRTDAALDVLVVGSVNLDVSVAVPFLPRPGETVSVIDTAMRALGGKGANQTVAAAAMGAVTALVAAVGDDADGLWLIDQLGARGVRTTGVGRVPGRSGWAHVLVDAAGENLIIVDPGANAALTADGAAAEVERLRPRAVLAQLEISHAAARAGLAAGRRVGAITLCNVSPAVDAKTLQNWPIDVVVVNRSEAHAATGTDDLAQAAIALGADAGRLVIITLGAAGAYVVRGHEIWHVDAVRADRVVDTTGAGDVFAGVLAAELAAGTSPRDAIHLAAHAASWSVARAGVVCPRRVDLANASKAGLP